MQKLQVVDGLTSNPLHSIPLSKGCFFWQTTIYVSKGGLTLF
jgi:hypothetical protein